jgi:hypothetical protein
MEFSNDDLLKLAAAAIVNDEMTKMAGIGWGAIAPYLIGAVAPSIMGGLGGAPQPIAKPTVMDSIKQMMEYKMLKNVMNDMDNTGGPQTMPYGQQPPPQYYNQGPSWKDRLARKFGKRPGGWGGYKAPAARPMPMQPAPSGGLRGLNPYFQGIPAGQRNIGV